MQPHSPLCCEHIYNSACSPFIHCSHLQPVMSLQVFMTPKSALSIREEEGGGGESNRFSVMVCVYGVLSASLITASHGVIY